jgi:hypothetical protein
VDSRLSGWQETCSMQCRNRYIPIETATANLEATEKIRMWR